MIQYRFFRFGALSLMLCAGAMIPSVVHAETSTARKGLASPSDLLAPESAAKTEAKTNAVAKTNGNSDAAIKAAAPLSADSISVNDGPPPATAFTDDALILDRLAEEEAAKAQADAARREQEHIEKSFDKAKGGLMPLSPDQVRDFMHSVEVMQQASQPPFAGPPKAEVKIATLSLEPGVEPQQINLAAGYVTTVNIMDSSGEPWPILDVGIGGNFEVTPTGAGSHVVRIMPLTRSASGNLSIILKDLSTPVIFKLYAGGDTVHMRYDARIPKMGPNAKIPLIAKGRRGPSAGDETIMAILQNSPPKGAARLKVSGVDNRTMAWRLNDKVYVRTPLSLLSPAWNASVSSTDGSTVYEIGDAPVLLMSEDGALVRARLMQDEEHDK